MEKTFKVLCTDKGSEFRRSFDSVLAKYDIRKFYGPSSTKCPQVEIVIKNLRTRIARFTEYKNSDRYIDDIQDIVLSYNKTYHSSIKMAPFDVNEYNTHIVYKNLYKRKMKFDITKYNKPYKFAVGSTVRISMSKGLFSREYKVRFSRELFTISRAYRVNGIELYDVKDCDDDVLTSAFYADELTKFREDKKFKFKIDRIYNEEVRGGKSYVLVTFEYSKCKEWILKNTITEV